MKIALITIGDELLSGFTVNTNASWISRQVLSAGGAVEWQQTVGDSENEIHHALKMVPENIQSIIITGGLGPTHDDITANVLCDYVDDTLVFDEQYWTHLKSRLSKRNLKLPEMNRNQAMKPRKGRAINNPIGSARGLHFVYEKKDIFALPGVPREMKAIMNESILPFIKSKSDVKIFSKTIRTTGIMESALAEKLKQIMDEISHGIKIAFLPQFIGVDIRCTGKNENDLENLCTLIETNIRKYIYGYDNETIENSVGKLLVKRALTISTAESCTGGLLGHRLTNIAGSSTYYLGGIVSYSNDVKEKYLGVSHETLTNFGAVSEETAVEMAEKIRENIGSDLGVSITGIAGPTGGTPEKPVGLVYVALADGNKTSVKELRFINDRQLNKKAASQTALNMVRIYLQHE